MILNTYYHPLTINYQLPQITCYNVPMLKRSEKVAEYELPIKIQAQKEGGYVVTCPAWKDCYAQGDSVEEATLEITAVAQALIELYKEEDKQIPLKPLKNKGLSNPFFLPVIVSA